MSDEFSHRRNAFQQTLCGLEYDASRQPDICSEACVDAWRDVDWTRFGYRFGQVFEPGVLHEVAVLEGVPYTSLCDLSHRPTQALRLLADKVAGSDDLSVVEAVNLAAALISVSRFAPAESVLARAALRATTDLERCEVAWLDFMISNRRDDGEHSARPFATMRTAVKSGRIPRGRTLDICTQAVVWHLKRPREVPADIFRWAVHTGNALVRTPHRLNTGTLSSWYRGIAMLPADRQKSRQTRAYMELAREAAEQTVMRNPGAFEKNTIKTYYESTLKEHMYVTRDREAAERAGRALIDLDPAWGPSYGELAECYLKFGDTGGAAELYEQASAAGPPYAGVHLLRAASCRADTGDDETAVRHYLHLTGLSPRSERVLTGGLASARRIGHPSRTHFEQALEGLANGSAGGGPRLAPDIRLPS